MLHRFAALAGTAFLALACFAVGSSGAPTSESVSVAKPGADPTKPIPWFAAIVAHPIRRG